MYDTTDNVKPQELYCCRRVLFIISRFTANKEKIHERGYQVIVCGSEATGNPEKSRVSQNIFPMKKLGT